MKKMGGAQKPSWLLMENVRNLLSSNGGFDFARVLVEMDAVGYDVEWNVFNTAEFAPQNRERVYLVGHLRGQHTKQVFPINPESKQVSESAVKIKQLGSLSESNYKQTNRVYDIEGLAPTLNTMQGGGRIPLIVVTDESGQKQVRKLTPLECWRLQGFSDEQFYKAKATGMSDSQLYKQAGNAVSVPIVKLIGEHLEFEAEKKAEV